MSTDYGRCPMENGNLPNRDSETGIRYGIVSLNYLNEYALESFEPVYIARCPECGSEIPADDNPEICHVCSYEPEFDGCGDDEWYSDEPDSLEYHNEGYDLVLDEHNDVWIFRSPHTTSHWSHCSPCAPGAAHLSGSEDHGDDLAYCLGAEWYE